MNKGLKKAVVFCLSAGMMMSALAGCSKKQEEAPAFDTAKAVVTVGSDSISAGVMNVAVRYSQASLESLYMQFGLEDPFNQDLYGNGTTLGEDVKTELSNTLGQALLAEQHMGDYGVTVSEEDKAAIAVAVEEFMSENDEASLAAMSIDKESVERFLELYMIKTKVEKEMCADVDTEVSDEEAAQRRIQYALFSADAEKEAAEAETELETEAVEAAVPEAETEAVEAAVPEAETEAVEAAAPEAETEAVEAATPEEETAALEENDADKTKSAAETEMETEEVTVESETEDPETAAYLALAYEHAQAMIADLVGGADFEETAEKYGKAPSDLTFGADYFMPQMVEATDGLEDNTVVADPVRSNGDSYYVIKLVSAFDAEATEEEKVEIVEQRKSARIEELYGEWQEETPIEVDAEAMGEIVFDFFVNPVYEETPEEESEIVVEMETEAETE